MHNRFAMLPHYDSEVNLSYQPLPIINYTIPYIYLPTLQLYASATDIPLTSSVDTDTTSPGPNPLTLDPAIVLEPSIYPSDLEITSCFYEAYCASHSVALALVDLYVSV